MTDEARLDAVIHGRVQGVGFRMFVVDRARELSLTGWVANEASGRVHCIAEGARGSLEQLLEAVRDGPRGAVVDRVDASWPSPTAEFERFEVRSGWHPGD